MSGTLNVKRYDAGLQKLASSFHFGNQFLDQFLTSSHSLDPNYGTTYVFLDDDDKIIIGYYNLGMGYIEECDGTTSVKLGGAVHINEFALDAEYQGFSTEDDGIPYASMYYAIETE